MKWRHNDIPNIPEENPINRAEVAEASAQL